MKLRLLLAFSFISLSNIFAQVIMKNNIPTKLPVGSELEIEVVVNKASIANFAKYQMDVPNGVVISEVDSRTGNFTFENNRAKVVWVSVPGEPEFTLKFKVFVNSLAPAMAKITQKFYFLDAGVKQEVDAEPIEVSFGNGTPVANTTAPKNTSNATIQTNTNTQPVTSVKTTTEPVPVTKTPGASEIVYKIQLGSSSTEPDKSKYASLGNDVKITKEGGMYKVLYGNFATKEEALKKLDEIGAKGFAGYTVKYQNGVRLK